MVSLNEVDSPLSPLQASKQGRERHGSERSGKEAEPNFLWAAFAAAEEAWTPPEVRPKTQLEGVIFPFEEVQGQKDQAVTLVLSLRVFELHMTSL